jgi:hypothetical protein
MADMGRRDWLSALVTSVVGAQVVIAAKDRQPLEGIIVPDTEIKLYSPQEADAHTRLANPQAVGNFVFMLSKGEYVPVGVLTEVNMTRDHLDDSSWEHSARHYIMGRVEVTGTIQFLGPAESRVAVSGFRKG